MRFLGDGQDTAVEGDRRDARERRAGAEVADRKDALLVAEALAAIDAHDGPVVVVSDEIGLGVVPLEPLGRAFRDLLGIAHQRLVARSDEAWFMVAGRPLALVDPEP